MIPVEYFAFLSICNVSSRQCFTVKIRKDNRIYCFLLNCNRSKLGNTAHVRLVVFMSNDVILEKYNVNRRKTCGRVVK